MPFFLSAVPVVAHVIGFLSFVCVVPASALLLALRVVVLAIALVVRSALVVGFAFRLRAFRRDFLSSLVYSMVMTFTVCGYEVIPHIVN